MLAAEAMVAILAPLILLAVLILVLRVRAYLARQASLRSAGWLL
jgi:hypothetical protein